LSTERVSSLTFMIAFFDRRTPVHWNLNKKDMKITICRVDQYLLTSCRFACSIFATI